MVAAKIELGWINQVFEGETPEEIIRNLERYQDFGCILRMGRQREGKKGMQELDKLEAFLLKYYRKELSMQDIKDLDIKLKLGPIKCHGIAETDEEIALLKKE